MFKISTKLCLILMLFLIIINSMLSVFFVFVLNFHMQLQCFHLSSQQMH
jgi:hypothetical protein